MEMEDTFRDQKKLRKAELISPPNRLKQKVGSGGIDEKVLMKATELMETNTIEFQPIAAMLVDVLREAISDAKSGSLQGEQAIEAMLYPAMQLKAQGGMFHYPLISDISNTLVNFLETVSNTDKDVLDIVVAHKMSINAVLGSQIKGDGGKIGRELREALLDACARYYKAKKH
ncbi:MAG: hypothetical protein GC185_00255 [Alphaproteobacteria bacterium]|nr:hypothetical protein [Alphaproteobacteria bacterium]